MTTLCDRFICSHPSSRSSSGSSSKTQAGEKQQYTIIVLLIVEDKRTVPATTDSTIVAAISSSSTTTSSSSTAVKDDANMTLTAVSKNNILSVRLRPGSSSNTSMDTARRLLGEKSVPPWVDRELTTTCSSKTSHASMPHAGPAHQILRSAMDKADRN